MHKVDYEEWQLTSLFEVEPTYPSPEDPWPYKEVVYSIAQGELGMSCAIHPAHKDVRIILTYLDHVIYEFSAMSLDGIEYLEGPSGESLRLVLSDREEVTLRINPAIRIFHKLSGVV